ncbi:MAG: FtsW/RodA/SpoVE family cell cycle protein [Anaerovoracaceae bacterium]|nr:FtsW/RodA/SpoVE family cell cycle protein [Anaerovoracaceae bacterium]
MGEFLQKVKEIFLSLDIGTDVISMTLRPIFVVLGLYILVRCIVSLVRSKNPPEVWAYLKVTTYTQDESGNMVPVKEISEPLTHWENVIGRGRTCDVSVNDSALSRNQGLLIRDEEGTWTYRDLGSMNGTWLTEAPGKESYKTFRTQGKGDRNAYLDYLKEMEVRDSGGREDEPVLISKGKGVEGPAVELEYGDTLRSGHTEFTLLPISLEEKKNNLEMRLDDTRLMSQGPSMAALTLFQILTFLQLWMVKGDEYSMPLMTAFGGLFIIEWIYVLAVRISKRRGLEMEVMAFFLCTLSLAVIASKDPGDLVKQTIAIGIGVVAMFILCLFLSDLDRSKQIRIFLIVVAAGLLVVNLVFSTYTNGAKNWLSIGGVSFQPSELVKVVFVWVGAGTLDELFRKKNLYLYLAFSLFCLAALALMGDFGTALIFFVTYLVISFLRSGEISQLLLLVGAAGAGGFIILKFRPYIATRFATWTHVWEPDFINNGGYQQTRTLTASASGGLLGTGAGSGWLAREFAADTDTVFGMLIEEWGLIIACFAVLSIVTLAFFAVRSITSGRSAFYTIAACGAMSMFVFQTMLNIFGCTDILPFTGVTFPFVSNGGTSMIVSWALLAFLKSADTRLHASLAVRGGSGK